MSKVQCYLLGFVLWLLTISTVSIWVTPNIVVGLVCLFITVFWGWTSGLAIFDDKFSQRLERLFSEENKL